MSWDSFIYFAILTVAFVWTGAIFAWLDKGKRSSIYNIGAILSTVASLSVFSVFIIGLWLSLERPPMRTMGETRLWYSFFAILSGLLTYLRWKHKWILSFSAVLSTVFIIINLLKPEIHDQSLMPALQSVWFIPHVTVYMFSYSLLGCAFIFALVAFVTGREDFLPATDVLVYTGLAFLTLGMLSGSLWAKQAWGQYWNWDPKETWAAITWMSYLAYIHLRIYRKGSVKMLSLLIVFSFLCLQMCWWGINYLPTAQDSIHVYNR